MSRRAENPFRTPGQWMTLLVHMLGVDRREASAMFNLLRTGGELVPMRSMERGMWYRLRQEGSR